MVTAIDGLKRLFRRLLGSRSSVDRSARGLQARWDEEYLRKELPEFSWYEDRVPEHLVRLIESGELPEGPALDLGCGPGLSTARIAAARPTVGLDIARNALGHARRHAAEQGVRPDWVVAAAPLLPFPSSTFGFVFERGTMQQLPRDMQPEHLREVARVLRPGGLHQLIGRAKAGDHLETLCPETLRIESIETFPGPILAGQPERMTHALLRRA